MVKILVSLLLLIGTPAYAEEVTPEVEAPAVEVPVAQPYVPPAEASNGAGGWAVVDPNTGVVHGVVVCTIDVCGPSGSWAGVLPGEYMGCTNCNLRFQTNATDDGNVAGYHGPDVKWDSSDDTFNFETNTNGGDGTTSVTKKLIPSKTASDGKRLETGFVNIETKYESNVINDSTVKVNMSQPDVDSPSSIVVDYPAWETLNYSSIESLKSNIDSDINIKLQEDGYDTESEEPSQFVNTIRYLTDKVRQFFGMVPLW